MKESELPYGPVPGWLPDWTNEDSYPYSDSKLGWAWEFLRRNPEYQKDYSHYISLADIYPELGGSGKFSEWWVGDDLRFYYCEPPALDGETTSEYYSRNHGIKCKVIPFEERLMEKWGIAHICDPSDGFTCFGGYGKYIDQMQPQWFDFESEARLDLGAEGKRTTLLSGEDVSDTDEYNHVFVRFDVRYPLDRQWESVVNVLKLHQGRLKNFNEEIFESSHPQLRKLPNYLRVYGATWNNVKQKEISKTIFPNLPCELPQDKGSKRVSNALRNARHLVFEGYRSLIMWA